MTENPDLTDFGFTQIPAAEKADRVAAVFNAVADKYDLMNDLMSFGLHRLWKKFTLMQSGVRRFHRVLDLAGGTGDLAAGFARITDKVILADINAAMLKQGRDRLLEKGLCDKVIYTVCDAENLPFPDRQFDCITMAFGLRNVTDKKKALAEMYRILKPGGKVLVLEFSKPVLPLLAKLYDLYSFRVIPLLGQWVCGTSEAYQYLAESIRKHPDQAALKTLMESQGFETVSWYNLTGGIVALHKGYRYG